jgi:hypothetical protein
MPKAHAPLPPGYLTPHFTLKEMIASDTADAQGIENWPDDGVDNLARAGCSKIRALWRPSLFVTSGPLP